MTQDQLIKTPKTMLDWFAENGVTCLGVDCKIEDYASILGGYAKIELNKATGRGDYNFMFWDEDGLSYNIAEYGEMAKEDAITLANIVKGLEDLLAKPYPTAKGTCVCTAACGAGLGHNKPQV